MNTNCFRQAPVAFHNQLQQTASLSLIQLFVKLVRMSNFLPFRFLLLTLSCENDPRVEATCWSFWIRHLHFCLISTNCYDFVLLRWETQMSVCPHRHLPWLWAGEKCFGARDHLHVRGSSGACPCDNMICTAASLQKFIHFPITGPTRATRPLSRRAIRAPPCWHCLRQSVQRAAFDFGAYWDRLFGLSSFSFAPHPEGEALQ